MNLIALIIISIFSHNSYALELKSGDILLQPLHCWACNLIEAQTKSEYSHIGVVTKVEDDITYVAEAFINVREVNFTEFNSKTQKGLKLKVLRPFFLNPDLSKNFNQYFKGLPYDSAYLWNDNEIYCSELVYKLFQNLNMITPKANPMTFDKNRSLWFKYFKGSIPDGVVGISPADFDDEDMYELIGFL
jgi:hypothetical protein